MILYFNPRLREGGDGKIHPELMRKLFQSTPPRRRRLTSLIGLFVIITISIHASAKEATSLIMKTIFTKYISIHASAKEATEFITERSAKHRISIHASAKEATCELIT